MMDPTLITAVTKLLETAIQTALKYDPATETALQALQGKVFCLECLSPDLKLYFVLHETQIQVLQHWEQDVSCSLTGKLTDLLRLLMQEQDNLADSNVHVSGEIGLLLQLKKLLANLDIDWEEALQDIFGDSLSLPLALCLRESTRWSKSQAAKVPSWINDVVCQELALSPCNTELEAYCSDVDDLRTTTDRLQATMQWLTLKLANKH